MKRVVFLGSKPIGYHCLKFLFENSSNLGIEVAGVLTNNNNRFDATLSIPSLCQDYDIEPLNDLNDVAAIPNIDYLISVQFHQILKQEHIDLAQELAVNLHMAPLPEYRGCNQFSFAIINGDHEFGTTLHVLDAGIDAGDILFERRFPIADNSMIKDLYDRTYEESLVLFQEKIGAVFSGNYTAIPQSELIAARGTSIHYRKEINDIKVLDLNWSADKIDRHIRGTYMPGFPPPYFRSGDRTFEVVLKED